ncbi:WW domain-binding protein 2 isoform X2 [Hermetia illucens]|uniref:WW domain-binding protein 2 isoform X2 n=1 Tax=Hermetia illucens TaxID=343691 RepID=UPI0018CC0822|nr:WW domain-binding protein 2 isoform X2 [Hermetia illucens]
MSLNTAHANNGVLIHAGEYILLFSDNVSMEFSGQDSPVFKGSKTGKIYLTTHRMIFNAKHQSDPLQSFSFPFISLSDVDIEQPTFGSNYIKGKVRAQPNGNWIGEAKFKLYFKSGGAIDFGQAMLRAARMAQRNFNNDAPPPYTPPTGGWYQAPPPAYAPNPQGYYGWVPPTQAFPNGPPPNTVFMTDNPPPYPGIVPPPQAQGYPNVPNTQAGSTTYNGWDPIPDRRQPAMGPGSNFPAPEPLGAGGYPPQAGGYPPQAGGYAPQAGGYPPQAGGYPPQAGGYPPQAGGGYPPQSSGGYPPQQPGGYPPQQPGGYPPQQPGGYAPQQPGGYPPQGPSRPNMF